MNPAKAQSALLQMGRMVGGSSPWPYDTGFISEVIARLFSSIFPGSGYALVRGAFASRLTSWWTLSITAGGH